MEYTYLSKILFLKLSDSLKEMLGGIAILYNEKKTVLGYAFFLTAFSTKMLYISFSFFIVLGW